MLVLMRSVREKMALNAQVQQIETIKFSNAEFELNKMATTNIWYFYNGVFNNLTIL